MNQDNVSKTQDWPECSQRNCKKFALFEYIWLDRNFACAEHMEQVLGIADVMGFSTPRNTVRFVEQIRNQ